MRGYDILLIIVAIIFPPLAVAMITGCSCDLLINIALTILGVLPGHAHAFWIIYKKIKAEDEYGRGQYTYISNGEFRPSEKDYANQGGPQGAQQQQQPAAQQPANYGATTGKK